MKKKAPKMTKKERDGYKVQITVGELPFAYDPFNKGAMEKLAYANRIGCGPIMDEENNNKPNQRQASLHKRLNLSIRPLFVRFKNYNFNS
jgi:hypothetical protein